MTDKNFALDVDADGIALVTWDMPGRSMNVIDMDVIEELSAIVDRVMRRVRAAHRVGRTVVLRLRFADFSRATRSHTLAHPTASTRIEPTMGPSTGTISTRLTNAPTSSQ